MDVFSKEEASRHFLPYGLANSLHVVTRKSLIEESLLFRTGDPLDHRVLEETERNLRAFRLFRNVRIVAEGSRVHVETEDAWTLIARGSLGSKGGILTYSVGAEERNLLGSGRQIAFRYDRGAERLTRSFTFIDPHVFSVPYLQFQLTAEELSDGRRLQAGLARPFFAFDSRYAAAFAFRNSLSDTTLYRGGEVDVIWKERIRLVSGEAGRRISGDAESVWRLQVSAEWSDVQLASGGTGPAPPTDPRRFLFAGLALEREGREWLKLRNVNRIGRDEDFELAPSGRVQVALSPRVEGSRAAARVRARASVGTRLPWGFALASFMGESRLEDGPRESIIATDIRTYAPSSKGTLAARVAFLKGWRRDPEQRVELDAFSGMRGYRIHAVSGESRLVANLEGRKVFVSDFLHLVSLGVALFVDDGFSWGPPDSSVHLLDVGAGLRIGLTRASSNDLLRIDLARALLPDPLGRSGWLVSFSSGQAF